MKRMLQYIIGVSATSVLALSASAEHSTNAHAAAAAYFDNPMPIEQRMHRLNGAVKVTDIIGKTVINRQEETIGKVEDIAVDVESGRIVQVILSTGGHIGPGDSMTAVPSSSLHFDGISDALHLNADMDKMKGAPRFDMASWNDSSDAQHVSDVYRYYGVDDDFSREPALPLVRLVQAQKVSDLVGMPVKNFQDESLGNIDNILVDLAAGRMVALVLTTGGFLGIGNELSAVPPPAFRFASDRQSLQLDVTREMLNNSPHFNSSQWPDFAESTYSDSIYRAYKLEPYFTTDADATALNVHDQDERVPTPLDQGSSQSDIDITANIRKEIIDGNNMSMNAKNVEIITNDGHVTLRGPVDSAEEKHVIGEIAGRNTRPGHVDNQLEVLITTTSN